MAQKKISANRNISRIEARSEERRIQIKGWKVEIHRRGEHFRQFLADSAYGGKIKALKVARIVRDKIEQKLPKYTRLERATSISKLNTSGLRGLRLRTTSFTMGKKRYNYQHVEAAWSSEPGVVVKKIFSVKEFGLEKAWELAIACRKKGLASLKS